MTTTQIIIEAFVYYVMPILTTLSVLAGFSLIILQLTSTRDK